MKINAGLLTSDFQLKNAIYKALSRPVRKTKSLENEIYYFLSPSTNIANAVQFYFHSESAGDTNVISIDLDQMEEFYQNCKMSMKELNEYLDGTVLSNDYEYASQIDDIKMHCKLSESTFLKLEELERFIISQVALKCLK